MEAILTVVAGIMGIFVMLVVIALCIYGIGALYVIGKKEYRMHERRWR